MEEDTEDILSTLGDYMVRLKTMDFSTTKSHLVADALKTFKTKDEDESFLHFHHWYMETSSWIVCKFAETNFPGISFPAERDDRLTILACYAAYMSVELVMDELYFDMPYRYCGANRTIKCIHEAVLACFDLLCKNLLIDKSWDAVSLRDSITKAADFATDYLTLQADELPFQADEGHDHFLLWVFQGNLTGNFGHKEIFSAMQPSTKATDDDVVGLSGDMMKIKERLVRSQSKLDIIPIVGMGGIGKTTLTRKVYTDPDIMPLFHLRAWIVVSREFHDRDMLLGLLESIAPLPDDVYKEDTETLAEILCRRLRGWRYFIVLDDIWTVEAWNNIKLCFPDDNNGSRIVLTSRLVEVACYVDRANPPHVMSFLGIEDSWKLLRKKMFGKDNCPRQLINIGMQIAEKCQGLPLAIEVMAGHLSNISKTEECWEDVAKRVGFPTDVTQMESFSHILSISYNDLPQHLKACFLTMVNFPKNFEISVEKLIRLWTAMGFLPQNLRKSMEDLSKEEVAMKCFENLSDRSLIMVRKKKFDGKAKLCGIHDLLWDLSMREFRKEGHKIFCDKSLCNLNYMDDCDEDDYRKYVIGISQTLIYFDQFFESDYPIISEGFKPLRVLDILNQSYDHFPTEITILFELRYLALATCASIPSLICKLSKLETLLNYHEGADSMLPEEIWLLAHLRHLHVGTCTYLFDPSSVGLEGSSESLLPNLQSLSTLSCSSCTKEVFSNIPNLKQLAIEESEEDNTEDDELLCCALKNLVNLRKLEILKLFFNLNIERPRCIPDWGSFLPYTIKNLTLWASNLPWSEMNGLAMLPNLEVLKLKDGAFVGQEWEMDDEDQFLRLKYLLLDSLDLIFWKANSDNFPTLQWLRIRGCNSLCRIPIEFGEIYTLELIDLEFCNQMIYQSAVDIQREQMTMGNDRFILQIGRAQPQLQMLGFVMVFLWLAMQLNIFKPKRGFRKKKLRNRAHPKTGKQKLLASF